MTRILLLTLLATTLAACTASPPQKAAQPPSFYVPLTRSDAVVDASMARDMISAYRSNKGIGPVQVDPDLQAVAQAEARAMAAADKPGSADSVKARLLAAGFTSPAANLSAGYYTLAEAFSGWRESPTHDRVLLDRQATRIGIATAYTPHSKYKVYWAMVVAADKR
jgi:uncharacterized protein YkwD